MPEDFPGVRFDRRTWTVLSSFLLLLLIGTAFKLHGASIAIWSQAFEKSGSRSGLLWGSAQNIRVDEWGTLTPAMLSQANQRPPFPQANPSWGGAKAPLVMNVPVRHFGVFFRPQYWGFFLLDLERGFSFFWNMKMLLLNTGIFLLLMLLTRNHLWVSLLGTAWVFFSGYVQWWYSTPAMLPEMVGCFALFVVAAHTLALAQREKRIAAAASLVLVGSAINFALCLYPPFQVPLAYLALVLLVGTLWPRLRKTGFRDFAALPVVAGASAAALLSGLVLAFYVHDARETIDLMRGTVYPGTRISLGGDVSLAQIFGGFYGFFMNESRYPAGWTNVCEASSFVLLFPVPLACLAWRTLRRRRSLALEWLLLSYVGILWVWMAVGWPRVLAVLSGFSLMPGTRAALGLGLAGIFWCCVLLSGGSGDGDDRTTRSKLLGSGAAAVVSLLFGLYFNRTAAGFLAVHEILLVSVGVGAACFSLLGRHRIGFAVSVVVPSCLGFGLINPVAQGLAPITDLEPYRRIQKIVADDPKARWIVYGPSIMADLIKSTGAQVFNGTLFVPPLEDLEVLDPRLTATQVYNRYAHADLAAVAGSRIAFEPGESADNYVIWIDPQNKAWRRLGVRYVVLDSRPQDSAFHDAASLITAIPEDRIFIYRYK